MKTGTRTQVPETGRSGISEDLAALVAQLLLLVGLAEPSSTNVPAIGSTLNAIGPANTDGAGSSTASPSKVSRRPGRRPRDLLVQLGHSGQSRPGDGLVGGGDQADQAGLACSGLSTGIAAIVVQFGLAMMPLGPVRRSRAG